MASNKPNFGKRLIYQRAESKLDELAVTTEHFINTPNGRMSLRMPNFVNVAEQSRRVRVIVDALNAAEVNHGK